MLTCLGTLANATTSTSSGLEISTQGVGLIGGCSAGQLLKWSGSAWACATDALGGGSFPVQEGGSDVTNPVAAINFGASDFNVTDNVGQANINIDYPNSGITRRTQNETISGTWSFGNASFSNITSGNWQGTVVAAQYGGTGLNGSAAANGRLLIGNGAGYTLANLAAGTGINVSNGAGSISVSSVLGTTVGGVEIEADGVTLGSQTVGGFVLALGALTGLTTTGNSGEASTPTLAVTYGSGASTAVQGNTSLTCASGSGNLTGGGNTITLGSGGSCSSLNTNNAVTFSASTTTPLLTSAGNLTVSATGGTNNLTLSAAGAIILSGFDCTGALNGGVLTADASGAITCDDDDGGAGGSISGSGTSNRIPLFSATTTIANSWLAQNVSDLELDNGRNLELLGGDVTVNGDVSATNLAGSGASVTDVDAALLGGQNGAYYLDVGNATGTLSITRIADGSITNVKLQNSSIGTSFGTNLSGSASVSLGGTLSVSLSATPSFTSVSATTFTGDLVGNASTASALVANPADCAADTYATAIAANGNLTCASITDAALSANVTKLGATITKDELTGSGTLGFSWGDSEITDALTISAGGSVANGALSASVTLGGNSFNGNSQLIQTTAGGLYPGLDGSLITDVDAAFLAGQDGAYYLDLANATGTLNIARIADSSLTNSKLQNSSLTVTAGSGLTNGGSVSLGSSVSLGVAYGAGANTAVQGNVQLTCSAGSGNLAGGGTVITLGTGGSCSTINTNPAVSFATSVTTPLVTNVGQFVLSATGAGNDITLTSADQIVLTGFDCSGNDNGGVLTVNASGELVCDNDDGGAAGTITGSGSTNRIPLYTGTQSLGSSWLAQNGSDLELDNTRNLELLGGNLTVTGNTVVTGTINTATISGGTLSGGTVSGGSLSAAAVNGLSVSGGTISVGVWNGTVITDTYVSDTLTVGASGSVADAALSGNVTKLGSAIDLATNEVAGNLLATNLQTAAADLGAADVNLNFSNTNGSFVTNLTLDGTVSASAFVGVLTGNASTATALAANPTDCAANQFATAIVASGNLTCAA